MTRALTSLTRNKLEKLILKISCGLEVSLGERIFLNKYAAYHPFLSKKLEEALMKKENFSNDS